VKYQKKVLLMGGLGNKFFQVARALELQRKSISIELVYIGPKMMSLYKLGGHTIHPEWFDILTLCDKLNLPVRPITFIELLFLGIVFVCKKVGIPIRFNEALDRASISQPVPNKTSWDVGYFQSRAHVSLASLNEVADQLVKLLDVVKNDCRQLTCHIRGGDFDHKHRPQRNQIILLTRLCESQSLNLTVVTNDETWAKQLMGEISYKICQGESAVDDFLQLASSSHLYLSNSTFSFWAALVANRSHNATIYLPDNWSYSDLLIGSEQTC
jgi:hypothetical protein